ncbi:hypothetical protein PV10_06613 [Exophiala mesophila]|uniref:Transcription factor domain-containing protein n=1 Tax=Exophiala mesophila TaxID=212818 RepID=A0A0D1ZBS5_EXOME|nr:uncharacterized protein PV10_06613 [Exophiala mesophila]KIV92152.1 hypothetical protein PV10_06613 [Exophiala mesophila]
MINQALALALRDERARRGRGPGQGRGRGGGRGGPVASLRQRNDSISSPSSSSTTTRSSSNSNSNSNNNVQGPTTDDDSDFSRCPSPLLTISGGYRVDPFARYPVERPSRGVRHMIDYYVHIWAPQQVSAATFRSGKNALVALVMPLASESRMLFEATIALTRASWVIRRGLDPLQDMMMLRHRSMASEDLRTSFDCPQPVLTDTVLLTMATLLTMNYMINDAVAFQVHLRALEQLLRHVSHSEDEEGGETRAFVRGRVLAFSVLASFLQADQPAYATRSQVGHRISTLTYPDHPFLPEISEMVAKLPEGIAEVVLSQSIAIEFISFLVSLNELFVSMSTPHRHHHHHHQQEHEVSPTSSFPQRAPPPLTIQRAIYDLQCLSALPLTMIERQLVRGLLAFSLHLYNETSFRIPLGRPLQPIVEGFNQEVDLTRHQWIQRCLLWCGIVIASAWDRQEDAAPQQHALLARILSEVPEARSWDETRDLLRRFWWADSLQDDWELCWRAASFKQYRQRRGASSAESMAELIQTTEPGHVSETTSSAGDTTDHGPSGRLLRWSSGS